MALLQAARCAPRAECTDDDEAGADGPTPTGPGVGSGVESAVVRGTGGRRRSKRMICRQETASGSTDHAEFDADLGDGDRTMTFGGSPKGDLCGSRPVIGNKVDDIGYKVGMSGKVRAVHHQTVLRSARQVCSGGCAKHCGGRFGGISSSKRCVGEECDSDEQEPEYESEDDAASAEEIAGGARPGGGLGERDCGNDGRLAGAMDPERRREEKQRKL